MRQRYYVNLTNACNRNCPFCCMYSGTKNAKYLEFDKFTNILNTVETKLDLLQLEGGEPVLHPQFYEFVEYACKSTKIDSLTVLTNGVDFADAAGFLNRVSTRFNLPICVKVSLNYYLDSFVGQFEKTCDMIIKNPNTDLFTIIGNVRYRPGKDDGLLAKIRNSPIMSKVCRDRIYPLQHYGLAKNKADYNDIMIVCCDLDWHVFACDGTDFGKNLIARSEYEGSMSTRKTSNEQ